MFNTKIRKHTPIMEALAESLDLTFEPEDSAGTHAFLKNFKLFQPGIRKKIMNVIRQRDPSSFEEKLIFDYQYTISTGNTSRTFNQTVYMVYSKTFGLPHFYMVPEKWYHRLGKVFGIDDIDFVEYPKFSKQYFLRGDDRDFIQHTFDQASILELFGMQSGYSLEGCNYVFVLYRHDKLLSKNHIRKLISTGEKITHVFEMKGQQWLKNHNRILQDRG